MRGKRTDFCFGVIGTSTHTCCLILLNCPYCGTGERFCEVGVSFEITCVLVAGDDVARFMPLGVSHVELSKRYRVRSVKVGKSILKALVPRVNCILLPLIKKWTS